VVIINIGKCIDKYRMKVLAIALALALTLALFSPPATPAGGAV